jgi:ComF family protein
VFARAAQLIGETVFPPKCIGCAIRGTALCRACRDELPYLPASVCRRCAGYVGPRGACLGCRRLTPAISSVRAAFVYEGAARTAVLTLKFKSGRYLAPLMGQLLREQLQRMPLHADVVVAVPLAPHRQAARGFNQALLLAEQIAPAVHGALISDALSRQDRRAQQTLDAADRLTNLQGAFTCSQAGLITNKRVLLIDDVVTTGATISACAAALADAGARRITALAFARDL